MSIYKGLISLEQHRTVQRATCGPQAECGPQTAVYLTLAYSDFVYACKTIYIYLVLIEKKIPYTLSILGVWCEFGDLKVFLVFLTSFKFVFINTTPLDILLFKSIPVVAIEGLDERIPLVFNRFKRSNKIIPFIKLIIQFCCTKNLFIYIYIYIYVCVCVCVCVCAVGQQSFI